TQSAAKHANALDRAIAFVFKAANDIELILGVAHHLSDIDVSRFAHQTDAAAATAHCVEITFLTEIVDDLHQVRLRDIETPRDVFDRRQLTVVEPDLNEDAQREIGMKRYTHLVSARPLSALPNVTGLPNFNEQGWCPLSAYGGNPGALNQCALSGPYSRAIC